LGAPTFTEWAQTVLHTGTELGRNGITTVGPIPLVSRANASSPEAAKWITYIPWQLALYGRCLPGFLVTTGDNDPAASLCEGRRCRAADAGQGANN
jgi:hypothetical protein